MILFWKRQKTGRESDWSITKKKKKIKYKHRGSKRTADHLIALLFCLQLHCKAKSTKILLSTPSKTGCKRTKSITEMRKINNAMRNIGKLWSQSFSNEKDKISTSRKHWACRYTGQTHPYTHIEKCPHVDSYHKICIICTSLGPLVMMLEECEQWFCLLQAIKQGGGNCQVKVTHKWRLLMT